MMNNKSLKRGTFVRVKDDNPIRGGKDGMVLEDYGEKVVLIFGYDRYSDSQRCECVGQELWHKDELDLSTAEY